MWFCENCSSDLNEESMKFCWNCGQPKGQKKESVSQASDKSSSSTGNLKQEAVTPALTNLADQPAVETPVCMVYDASVFAAQFPQWDLLPPGLLVKRIKRSI